MEEYGVLQFSRKVEPATVVVHPTVASASGRTAQGGAW
jgi:hypothetical protein